MSSWKKRGYKLLDGTSFRVGKGRMIFGYNLLGCAIFGQVLTYGLLQYFLKKLSEAPLISRITKVMCFFLCFSSLFFSPNLRGRAKKIQTKCPKKKNTGSVSETTWPTNDIPNLLCWAQSFFCLFFNLPHNDKVKQLPVTTKVGLFLILNLSSQAKNVLESSTETFINIANAFVLPRSLVRWEAWPRFRFQAKHISWCFCQSKSSLLSAESTFDDFNRKDHGFWFSVTRQCNSLASA